MKLINLLFIVFISGLLVVSCAKKGRPTGGPKDENAPLMVTAKPPYGSTNFNKKNIRIYFDEYITLKNLQKQLIISPPFKNQPVISPQGIPSKYINIKFTEELQPNTTYTFNFGDAVQDNNENNILENFKYVFSTGSVLDSLTIKGKVGDALLGKLKKNTSVLLYRIDSAYTDSIIFKNKPNYVTNTTDSLNFKFDNIRKGKYILLALQEDANDYIFNPKTDKIGFLKNSISLPQDSVLKNKIVIFKEKQPFKFKRGKEVSKGKIQFGYLGQQKDLTVKLLSKVPAKFKAISEFENNKDTLNYWFTPIEKDSLKFIISNNTFKDTITIQLRKKKLDSLSVATNIKGILNINDTLFINTNNPITDINKSKLILLDKDSTKINYTITKKDYTNIAILFKQKPKDKYNLTILPKAFTDIYSSFNDSLSYKFITKEAEDYGNITLNINNKTNNNLIIELLEKENVKVTKYINSTTKKVVFNFLKPEKYKIRAIIDENNNNKWDTGNFLMKTQPEKIIYFPKEISLRANWTIDEHFIIE